MALSQNWLAYDQPDLQGSVAVARTNGWLEAYIAVDGVHCAACVRGVQKALGGRVRDLSVHLVSRTATFRFNPVDAPLSALLQSLDDAGYRPHPLAQDLDAEASRLERRRSLARLAVATICAMQVMMLAWPDYFDAGKIDAGIEQLLRWSQWVIATPAVLYCGWPYLASAWQQIRLATVGMDTPIAVSILIAYAFSAWRTLQGEGAIYFDAATMFIMLLGAGRYLEGRTRAIAVDRLRSLAGRRPLTATRIIAGHVETVATALLNRGDEICVAPGDVVPADGALLDTLAQLDESILTGESRPVYRKHGDTVLAGSLNGNPFDLHLRVTGAGEHTRLAGINRMLLAAERDKPTLVLTTDRIASRFVLGVLFSAAMAAFYRWPHGADSAINAALAVLLVSCPCALSLAIPAVYAAAANLLSMKGVLLLRPSALDQAAQASHIVFDKTGTLTRAEMEVARVEVSGGMPREACIAVAAALERGLHHPLAKAIGALDLSKSCSDRSLETRGIAGTVEGRSYRLEAETHLDHGDAMTWLALTDDDGGVLARFGLRASPRTGAAHVVGEFKQLGLHPIMCTGDAQAPACAAATALGLPEVHWNQTPADKLGHLRSLQKAGAIVMAVGDGINDGPLLSAADVGVAMPGGAAITQAHADVILTGDSLDGLLELHRIAGVSQLRIRQNLGWAIGYNLLMLPFAFLGYLTPVLAALGMSVSSLIVVANALRLGGSVAPANAPGYPDAQMEH